MAAHAAAVHVAQLRRHHPAALLDEAAAGGERAARSDLVGRQRPARDRPEPRRALRRARPRRHEPGRVRVPGVLVERVGAPVLHEESRVHDGDAVADGGGEFEVVSHEDHPQTPLAPLLVEDCHHLRLRGDVERRGGLVGQEQPRLDGERRGDHHALQQATRELVRILVEAPGRVVDADVFQDGRHGPTRLRRPHAVVGHQCFGEKVADLAHRVDVCGGVLKDHRHLTGQKAPQGVTIERQYIVSLVEDAATHAGAGRQQTDDGAHRHRLAGSRFADQPQSFARVHTHRRLMDHRPRNAVHGQVDVEPVDLQQRAHCVGTENRVARRSPSRLKATTVATMSRPAYRDSCGFPVMMEAWPLATMRPHSGVGGATPRPR
jgi:hypothetical protein